MQSRRWRTFSIVALVAIASDFAYMQWREHSLEPLTMSIDLSRPGRYTLQPWGFHASNYYASFRLRIEEPPDVSWDFGPRYEKVWGENRAGSVHRRGGPGRPS